MEPIGTNQETTINVDAVISGNQHALDKHEQEEDYNGVFWQCRKEERLHLMTRAKS